jgi:hypothetical protein
LLEWPPAVHEVGGSNPGRDMSVSAALVEDRDDLGEPDVIQSCGLQVPDYLRANYLEVPDHE